MNSIVVKLVDTEEIKYTFPITKTPALNKQEHLDNGYCCLES